MQKKITPKRIRKEDRLNPIRQKQTEMSAVFNLVGRVEKQGQGMNMQTDSPPATRNTASFNYITFLGCFQAPLGSQLKKHKRVTTCTFDNDICTTDLAEQYE